VENVLGNLEQVFLVFQTLQNQTCLRVEGRNFQHHLSHVLNNVIIYIHYMGK
jgi:hypothetical protein